MGDVGAEGTAWQMGKRPGRDAAMTRPNLAHGLGVAGTRRRVARLMVQAGRVVEQLAEKRPAWGYLLTFHCEFFVANASRVARNAGAAKVAV
ncbi:MAG: hypothetical protein J6386_19975 [Candidatus Synoicihabitans palmerolidicus]|nr:hypothetical protein [Candidatus Synoicihabitans palmerolidicus]